MGIREKVFKNRACRIVCWSTLPLYLFGCLFLLEYMNFGTAP